MMPLYTSKPLEVYVPSNAIETCVHCIPKKHQETLRVSHPKMSWKKNGKKHENTNRGFQNFPIRCFDFWGFLDVLQGSIPSKMPGACQLFPGTQSTAGWTWKKCKHLEMLIWLLMITRTMLFMTMMILLLLLPMMMTITMMLMLLMLLTMMLMLMGETKIEQHCLWILGHCMSWAVLASPPLNCLVSGQNILNPSSVIQ